VLAIGAASIVALSAVSGMLDAVNRLPLMGNFLESVGLVYTCWFTYRYLLFGPARDELATSLRGMYKVGRPPARAWCPRVPPSPPPAPPDAPPRRHSLVSQSVTGSDL